MSQKQVLFAEKVLAKRNAGQETKYLIKWRGLPIEKATWKEERYLQNINSLIEEFEQNSVQTQVQRIENPDLKKSLKKSKKIVIPKVKEKEGKAIGGEDFEKSKEKKNKDISIESFVEKIEKSDKIEKTDKIDKIENKISENSSSFKSNFTPDLMIDAPEKVLAAKIFENSASFLELAGPQRV